jgi:hypothetical protein
VPAGKKIYGIKGPILGAVVAIGVGVVSQILPDEWKRITLSVAIFFLLPFAWLLACAYWKTASKAQQKYPWILILYLLPGVVVWLSYPQSHRTESALVQQTSPIIASVSGSNVSQIIAPGTSKIVLNNGTIGVLNSGSVGSQVINSGPSTDQIRSNLLEALKDYERAKGPEILTEFPLGYAIFGITATTEIVPFEAGTNTDFIVDWRIGDPGITMTKTNISLDLPRIWMPRMGEIENQRVTLDRKEGAGLSIPIGPVNGNSSGNVIMRDNTFIVRGGGQAKIMAIGQPAVELVIKLARTRSDGVVMVLGAKPSKNP